LIVKSYFHIEKNDSFSGDLFLMLIKKIFLLFFISFVFLTKLNAQEYGTLRGLVTDSTSGESLAYCSVLVKELGQGSTTDARGYFIIPKIPANKNFTLIVSYVGYKANVQKIILVKDKVTQYNIKLVPIDVELQTIEKIGKKEAEKNETNISVQRLAIRDLEALPQGVETDVFRSLQYLPGVQASGDVSARFYVRGGDSNQNLIIIDGVTLYSPFHALGLFSVVDPDMINNVEFFKGGFPADFGGRLSSVVKITTKDGNKNNYSAKASASLLSGKLLLEGPLPHGSFILTGRKSYSTQIIKKYLNDETAPVDFYDFSFKANLSNPDFMDGGKFTFNGFFSGDKIKNSDPTIEDFKWSNNLLGMKWFQVGDSPLFYELGLSLSQFEGDVLPKLSNALQSSNSVNDVQMHMDVTYMFDNKNEIGVGFHINSVKTELFMENSLGVPADLGSSATNISVYTKYKFMQWDFIGIDIGGRFNLATLSTNSQSASFEPRISFTLRPFSLFAIKGAWGKYQQEMTTISNENEAINIYEPWVISPEYLKPAMATHYILGLSYDPIPELSLSVEGYYKNVDNLPWINNNKIFASDSDFVAGKGESYGLEFMSKLNLEQFSLTASYTHAYAYKEIEGKRYYPRYDIRHTVNLTCEYNFGSGWSASAVWIYNSGLPFTKIIGYYDKYYLSDIFASWYELDQRKTYTMLGIQNLGRLPDYHRLDISVTKKQKFGFANVEIGFSIINVYDRKNIFYFKQSTGERVNMLPFMPTATIKVEI
jgi:hypothetical protein